jgi:hypothetical protein
MRSVARSLHPGNVTQVTWQVVDLAGRYEVLTKSEQAILGASSNLVVLPEYPAPEEPSRAPEKHKDKQPVQRGVDCPVEPQLHAYGLCRIHSETDKATVKTASATSALTITSADLCSVDSIGILVGPRGIYSEPFNRAASNSSPFCQPTSCGCTAACHPSRNPNRAMVPSPVKSISGWYSSLGW